MAGHRTSGSIRRRGARVTVAAALVVVLAGSLLSAGASGAAPQSVPTVTVTGHFRDAAGSAQVNWTISLADPNTLAAIPGATAVTDHDGAFSISAPPGTYAVNGTHGSGDAGFLFAGPWVFTTGGTQDLTWPTVTKKVVVEDTHHNPVPGATVRSSDVGSTIGRVNLAVIPSLIPGGSSALGWQEGRTAITDSTGVARLHVLSATSTNGGFPIGLTLSAQPPSGAALLNGQVTGLSAASGSAQLIALAPKPTIVPGSASIAEGNSGTRQLLVPVTLSQATTATVTAHWTTQLVPGAPGHQADPLTDYQSASGTVTFAPGQVSATVPITVDGDTIPEPDEYIVVSFTDPFDAFMGGYWGLGFGGILNDDGPSS